jgi:hypothetical protein
MAAPEPLDPLLAKHKADIESLRAAVGAILPTTWDEISLLRYVLSFPDASERQKAVRDAIAWREKNAAMLAAAAAGSPAPHEDAIRPHMIQGFHASSVHGEPLYIVRAGLSSPISLLNSIPTADILEWLMFYKETGS